MGICLVRAMSVMDPPAMADMNEVILKTGRYGRLRYTPEQKQALIEAGMRPYQVGRRAGNCDAPGRQCLISLTSSL
jgi:hypothetical protein